MDEMLPNVNLDDNFFIPEVTEEQTAELAEERNLATLSYPVKDVLLTWFDEQITITNSLSGIDAESHVSIEVQVLAKRKLASLLEVKRSELISMFDEFSK